MVLLPFKFFKYALDKNDLFIRYKKYEKSLCKVLINRLRTKFLLNCKKSDIVPKFLRFRIIKTNHQKKKFQSTFC